MTHLATLLLAELRAHGGFSARPAPDGSLASPPSHGAMVSLPSAAGLSLVCGIAKLDQELPAWLDRALPALDGQPDRYLGGWLDSQSGSVYLGRERTRGKPVRRQTAREPARATGCLGSARPLRGALRSRRTFRADARLTKRGKGTHHDGSRHNHSLEREAGA